jgi:hypothetical protein
MSGGLAIDSSKRSLKVVLLHNGSKYASVPVAHSVHLKESYENLALVLTKLNCEDHGWMMSYIYILKYCPCYLDSNQDIPSTDVSCVNGIAELRANTGPQNNGPVRLL